MVARKAGVWKRRRQASLRAYSSSLRITVIIPTLLTTLAVSSCDSAEEALLGNKNCDEYSSQAAAQSAFNRGASNLDGDNDGIACENLR
jgi:hypothetical protein